MDRRVWLLIFGILILNVEFIRCDDDAAETEEGLDAGDSDGSSSEGEFPEDNDVLVLTDKTFHKAVNNNEFVLAEFYAPWCGHCKSLAPEFEKAAATLKEKDPKVILAKIDATEEKSIASEVGVSGYPTLKWYKNGQMFDYDGPRNADGIVNYMVERTDPSWKPPPEAVITLTQANFSEVVDASELILVEFYAPWCGHCKQLAPEYEKAAKELVTADPPIPLAKVDCTAESDIARKYSITGYPTLKMFRRGKEFEYKGERKSYSIINYMRSQQAPASKDLASTSDVKAFMKEDDITIVAFFKAKDSKQDDIYEEAANDLRDTYDLAHTFSRDAANNYKVNAPSLVVFMAEKYQTKHEQKYYVLPLEESTTPADIKDFILKHNVPLVGEYKSTNMHKIYNAHRPLVLMFYTVDFSFEGRKVTQMWRLKLAEIAKDYSDMTFAIANEDNHASLLKSFGFDDSGEEMNIGILDSKDRKFPMPVFDSFDADEIREFIDLYSSGKVSPKYKSQQVPKKQKGSVKVVVGSTFEKIVGDKTKDVLIEFTPTHCQKCKEFAPKYTDLAKKYAKTEKKLVFAKIDSTANEFPEQFVVDAFPTFYLVPAQSDFSSAVKYPADEEVTAEKLTEFIKKNAKLSVLKDEL